MRIFHRWNLFIRGYTWTIEKSFGSLRKIMPKTLTYNCIHRRIKTHELRTCISRTNHEWPTFYAWKMCRLYVVTIALTRFLSLLFSQFYKIVLLKKGKQFFSSEAIFKCGFRFGKFDVVVPSHQSQFLEAYSWWLVLQSNTGSYSQLWFFFSLNDTSKTVENGHIRAASTVRFR